MMLSYLITENKRVMKPVMHTHAREETINNVLMPVGLKRLVEVGVLILGACESRSRSLFELTGDGVASSFGDGGVLEGTFRLLTLVSGIFDCFA